MRENAVAAKEEQVLVSEAAHASSAVCVQPCMGLQEVGLALISGLHVCRRGTRLGRPF